MSRLMIDRRTFLSGAMALGAATSAPAWASDAPITLIVPFAAGGPTDIVARLAAEGMARRLMRPIIVENVGGAGGATGTLRAARARPDGSVMVLGQMATHALTPLLNANAGYDPVADFEPIGIAATAPMVLAARKGLPAGSLPSSGPISRHSDKLSFGHAGLGATSQVACDLFNMLAGAMPASVAYRGTAPALNDLVAGQIDFMCDQVTSIAPQIRFGTGAGRRPDGARALADPSRFAHAAEQGAPDLHVEVWNGLLFPKGTPAELVAARTAR